MINTLDFPGGLALKKAALPAARNIAKLKARFHKKGLPVIYVNDNFGEWSADWKTIYDKCFQSPRGSELARILKPDDDDFFILKPKHSGFYLTALEALLGELKIKSLVMTGIASDICVLFTAHDAHMRGFKVIVARDCIAANSPMQTRMALSHLSKVLKLATPLSKNLP